MPFSIKGMKRELIRYAIREATAGGTTPTAILEALHSALAAGSFSGSSITGTTANGHTVTFAPSRQLSQEEAIRLVGDALDWVAEQADPTAPGLPKRYTRLGVSFARALLT